MLQAFYLGHFQIFLFAPFDSINVSISNWVLIDCPFCLKLPLPEEPDTEDEAEIRKWKWKVKNVKKDNNERHSQRCDIELKLAVRSLLILYRQLYKTVSKRGCIYYFALAFFAVGCTKDERRRRLLLSSQS